MGFPVLPPQERPAEPFADGVSLPDEISSSSCVFEPANEQTKRFNSGIRITVRYVRSLDAEGLLSNLINQIEGSHDLRQDSLGNGFGYPVMWQNVGETVASFKEIPTGTMVLQIALHGPSRQMSAGMIYPDIVNHGLKLTSAILGGAPAAPGIPQGQLVGEAESLAGQNTMGVEVFLDGKSLLPEAQPTKDIIDELRGAGIKVLRQNPNTRVPTLTLNMDTLYAPQYRGPGAKVFTLRLEFRQPVTIAQHSGSPKQMDAATWSEGTFGVNSNSDRYREEASGLVRKFLKDYQQANGGAARR